MKRSVGFEVHSLSNLFQREIRSTVGKPPGEVTHLHGFVIEYLFEHQDQEVFQRDFEEHLSIRRSTASRMLQLMERNGLITREGVGRDARLKRIQLTPKAVEMHQRVVIAREQLESKVTAGVSPEDLEVFFRVVEQMQRNLA